MRQMVIRRFRKADNLVHFLEAEGAGSKRQITASVLLLGDDDNTRLTVISHVRWPGARYQRWTKIVLNDADELVTLVRAWSETEANKRMYEQLDSAGYEIEKAA